jgi:hypothetical protein
MSFSYMQPSNAPMQNGQQSSQQKPSPYQQYSQPQQQPQQQSSPYSTPDMAAYARSTYNANNVPRAPQKGARVNDLSGQVPSNQIWAQAYNQASNQYGGNTQAQSWTMPGSFTSQGYNPANGQYGPMTGGQSWDGNMAYNAIDQRPGPITADATGIGGSPMQWQDTLAQRDAFVNNLTQRLGQYSGGQLTGQPTFDTNQLLSQADSQLASGTYYNPFAQQSPDFQQAMGNANQYMQGQFQNPFGNSPQANNPMPTWGPQYAPSGQQQYAQPMAEAPITLAATPTPRHWDYGKPYDPTEDNAASAAGWGKEIEGPGWMNKKTGEYWNGSGSAPWENGPQTETTPQASPATPQASAAQPIPPADSGSSYSPQQATPSLPPVPQPVAQPVAQPAAAQPDPRAAQLQKIDTEIGNWQNATYGTWKGSGPPAEYLQHIQALQRLRRRAAAGDPAAMAWSPKIQAPGAHVYEPEKGSSDRVYRNGPGGWQWRQRPGS